MKNKLPLFLILISVAAIVLFLVFYKTNSNFNWYLVRESVTLKVDAGYVYAPYMPLYATPTQVLDDFIFRKGLATSYGQAMINNKLYAKGSIKNFSADRMKPAEA